MTYSVKEIFFSLQGEGMNTGRPAVFCRFAGCNLWTGRELDRNRAICQFCDTDFVGVDGSGGGKFASAAELADAIAAAWPTVSGEAEAATFLDETGLPESGWAPRRFVVLTGGEPLLQCDDALVVALHDRDFEVAVETNGTQRPPGGLDWICVSPKAGAPLLLTRGDELKLVFPQSGLQPYQLEHLQFDHFLLQPMDGPSLLPNIALAAAYCQSHRRWRLSLQTHKLLGIR